MFQQYVLILLLNFLNDDDDHVNLRFFYRLFYVDQLIVVLNLLEHSGLIFD